MLKALLPAIGFSVAATSLAFADDQAAPGASPPACTSLPEGEDALLIEGPGIYRLLAGVMKQKGENYWRRPYNDNPPSLCLAEQFQLGEFDVRITHADFERRAQTLFFRIEAVGEESREILVLYSPVVDWISRIHRAFSVVETRGRTVRVYALYHEDPTYKQVRSLAEAILKGNAEPIVTAEWRGDEDAPIFSILGEDAPE